MESLISTVNKLQDICQVLTVPLPLDLPQIAVVGTQSSGKSSVIEAIVKREFLPRGSGIVTRRPLIIRLVKVNDNDLDNNNTAPQTDWVTFTHSDKVFRDFDEVRQEIEQETDRICGSNKGICAEPITLNVYSKNVVNLTLVDLPGLTKNPVGSQPEDIEIQIRELVIKYIKNPNSIILAVTAANTDFATSEAIKLAREFDPEGKRTIAVLTKLDIMDPGTDALEVLSGRLITIKLGIIGVINRSQKDILENKPIEKAIEDEANFLQRRYPTIADRNGQPYLSKRLSEILMHHIQDCLPNLKSRVYNMMSKCQAELNDFGDPVIDEAKTIIDIITKFSLSYCDTIKGCKRQVRTKEICGGARIQFVFHAIFGKRLSAINPLEELTDKKILTAAKNAAGVRTSICVPDVFELLVVRQIEKLEEPSLRCVELIHQEMVKLVDFCDEVRHDLLRFPRLREKIEEILIKLLDERLPVTKDAIRNLVGYGTALIDTEHPGLRELSSRPIKSARPAAADSTVDDVSLMHESELKDCEIIARKINAYFSIVRDEIKVFVPRAIMHTMVNHIKSNLHSTLIKELYRKDLFKILLSESDEIARKRTETVEMLATLKKACEVINAIDQPIK